MWFVRVVFPSLLSPVGLAGSWWVLLSQRISFQCHGFFFFFLHVFLLSLVPFFPANFGSHLFFFYFLRWRWRPLTLTFLSSTGIWCFWYVVSHFHSFQHTLQCPFNCFSDPCAVLFLFQILDFPDIFLLPAFSFQFSRNRLCLSCLESFYTTETCRLAQRMVFLGKCSVCI